MSDEICGDVCASDRDGKRPCVLDTDHDGSHCDRLGGTWARPRAFLGSVPVDRLPKDPKKREFMARMAELVPDEWHCEVCTEDMPGCSACIEGIRPDAVNAIYEKGRADERAGLLRLLKVEQQTYHAGPGFTRTRWRQNVVGVLKDVRRKVREGLVKP